MTIDLDELARAIGENDAMFRRCLNRQTGEIGFCQGEPLPLLEPSQYLKWMDQFVLSLKEGRLGGILAELGRHPAPMRRFQEILRVNPDVDEQWRNFLLDRYRELAQHWLEVAWPHSSE